MSINFKDPRCIRTRREIEDSFIRLVGLSGFDSVSVRQVCRQAGVNRSTFYMHYQDKYELLETCMLGFYTVFIGELDNSSISEVGGRLPELIRMVAAHCMSRRAFLLRILEDGKFPAFHNLFTRRMELEVGRLIDQLTREGRVARSGDNSHRITFLSSAYFGSLLHWVKYGSEEGLEVFSKSMAAYTMAVLMGTP